MRMHFQLMQKKRIKTHKMSRKASKQTYFKEVLWGERGDAGWPLGGGAYTSTTMPSTQALLAPFICTAIVFASASGNIG